MSPEDEQHRRQQTLLRSFRVAWDGFIDALRIDRNLRIHAAATVVVVAAGAWVRLNALEWSVIVLTISLVWVAELLNTAIEAVVDLASPEHHELARRAKDVASAAVLMAALAAVVVGVLIFGPRLIGDFERETGGRIGNPSYVSASSLPRRDWIDANCAAKSSSLRIGCSPLVASGCSSSTQL